MIKSRTCLLLCTLLSCCTLVDSSNFKYLNDENLELHPMLIIGAEQDVEISLPRGLVSRLPATLFVRPEGLQQPYSELMAVRYEWQWRSLVQQDEGLYLFELAFRIVAERRLQSESVPDRINTEIKDYTRIKAGSWRESFSLPISNERQLVIRFWYNENWAEEHPLWLQRRKALSRRIVGSVRLLRLN